MDTTDSTPIEHSNDPILQIKSPANEHSDDIISPTKSLSIEHSNDPISPTKLPPPVTESVIDAPPIALEVDVTPTPTTANAGENDPLEYLSAKSGGSSSGDSPSTPSSTCSEHPRLSIAEAPPLRAGEPSVQNLRPDAHAPPSAISPAGLATQRQSLAPNQSASAYPSVDTFKVAFKVLVDPALEPGNPDCIYRFDGSDEVHH